MPYSKFFWTDWESDPNLKLCSLAAQGLWMRMLCICAKSEPRGYLTVNGIALDLDGLSVIIGRSKDEIEPLYEELKRNGVFSITRSKIVFSRRIVQDEKRSSEGRKHKQRGLEQASEKKEKKSRPSRAPKSAPTSQPERPPPREPERGPSPQSPESRVQSPDNNNSEDKSSSSLLPSAQARNDDGFKDQNYDQFIYRHPKPRKSSLGEIEWRKAMEAGVDPDLIIGAAERYATVSSGYDRDKVMFSDNWLLKRAWEKYPPTPPGVTLSLDEALEAAKARRVELIKSGKPFLCTQISGNAGRELIAEGLVTEAECEAVGVQV